MIYVWLLLIGIAAGCFFLFAELADSLFYACDWYERLEDKYPRIRYVFGGAFIWVLVGAIIQVYKVKQ